MGERYSTDLSTASPTLTITLDPAGHPSVAFNKSISDGVKIFSRRGSETTFAMLTIDTSSPYVDNRVNLGPGPESRDDRGIYVLGDDPIGNMSATFAFVVPTPVNPPPPPGP